MPTMQLPSPITTNLRLRILMCASWITCYSLGAFAVRVLRAGRWEQHGSDRQRGRIIERAGTKPVALRRVHTLADGGTPSAAPRRQETPPVPLMKIPEVSEPPLRELFD